MYNQPHCHSLDAFCCWMSCQGLQDDFTLVFLPFARREESHITSSVSPQSAWRASAFNPSAAMLRQGKYFFSISFSTLFPPLFPPLFPSFFPLFFSLFFSCFGYFFFSFSVVRLGISIRQKNVQHAKFRQCLFIIGVTSFSNSSTESR